jgi:endogenous inhibitor of DNA gyrase (YacG/DUF329 family)
MRMTGDQQKPGPRRPRRRTAAGRCPTCGAETRPETRPFCSRRCADVDLGRWFSGAYRVPTSEAPGDARSRESGEDDEYSNDA